jgi:hypothetical protein
MWVCAEWLEAIAPQDKSKSREYNLVVVLLWLPLSLLYVGEEC